MILELYRTDGSKKINIIDELVKNKLAVRIESVCSPRSIEEGIVKLIPG